MSLAMPPLTGAGRALGLLCLLAASVVGSGGGNLDSVVARQWGAPGIHPPSPRPLFLRGGARKGRPKVRDRCDQAACDSPHAHGPPHLRVLRVG